MAISQFSWARSHYDVIVMSYINGWYLFWYQWKEDAHTYTLVVNLGLYVTTPPLENMFGKNPQDRAHSNHSIRSSEFEDTEYLY